MTLTIPPIGLGTGGAEYLDGAECVDVVSAALEMGYRHIDTAQSYGNEAAVGKAIARSDVAREDILLATKVEKTRLSYDDVIESTRESLEKLRADTIDLLYVHFPTQTYDPEDTLPALDALVDEGAVDHVGVSNFSPDDLDVAREVLSHPIAANQIEMHPLCRQEPLVEYATRHDLPLVAYTPIARGTVFDVPELTAIAEKHGVSEAAVALAWITSIDGASAIPKTTSRAHLRENLAAADLTLDPEDVSRIESIEAEEKFVDIA